jgi:putative transposase
MLGSPLVQPKYNYRRRLPHIQKDERPLFITFASDRRWHLPPTAREIVLNCCLAHPRSKYELLAAVVMPDHAHLILSPLRRPDGWCWSLPEIMHAIKGSSAHGINQLLGRSGAVWQEEFFDHVLRSNESLEEKIEYICNNPVRAGLVSEPHSYPWLWRSSVGTGL